MIIAKPLTIKQPQAGKLIREMRSHLGLTQEQLALSLGVTCSSANRWENTMVTPSPLAMQKIEAMLKQMGDRGQELLVQYSH
ncbi:helix-turn-helix domain-containing protein [Chlorogloea sp. CCALA 695]|uniref:helix-turn-helix domain-containing protein n=1 Tax=Chlorogloea sp. CCALA 695 TaxID=2107693 RepID=UPI0018EE18BA|nr:helix-turn-helix transcriptional regulator [Chlorogloea sp. CCALA 695]